MSKEELLKYLIAEIDLIMHDKDYRFENANGTWYSRESCRDLTNEEVFEELRTELRQFADLEAKLAESEKKFIVANNLRKNSDEVLLNYKTKKYGLDKTIQELRKTKLSLPEKEWYYKGFENCERQMSSHIADLTLEVNELKQQLAEKEKYTYIGKEVGKIERKYDNKINALKQQLKCQPVEIVEKIIYHYDLNQIRDQFKNGFYGDARCVTIDGLGLIVYLEEMLKEYQK